HFVSTPLFMIGLINSVAQMVLFVFSSLILQFRVHNKSRTFAQPLALIQEAQAKPQIGAAV
ncbi:hypothetical protein, partial [Dolosicoccus paucivorans]|uniref:hypothetical protein n=1 Tax=Dolosicoccus paucivorans TaxID=84521 RepID=UPI001CA55FC7